MDPIKKAQSQEERIESYLKEIASCMPGNFYWKDKNGVYLGCSNATLVIPGYKDEKELVGKTDYDIWPDQAEELRENDAKVMESGMPAYFEEVVQRGDETKYYAVIKTPLKNANGEIVGIIGNSLDITYRKEAESLKIENELHRAKIIEQESIKKLSDQLVHDIRTPLLVLSNILNMCKNLTEKEHIMLRDSIASIQRIAHGLLGSYGKEKNTPLNQISNHQHILLSQALEEIVFHKRCQYDGQSENFRVDFQYSFDPFFRFTFIRGNVASFERMMNNLINNSVEAIGEKRGVVNIGFRVDDENVKIIVRDNGKGMPLEMAEKLMKNESVSSTKEGGFGIGTTQIQDTLRELNGSQFIESKPGVGTKIILTIPKANDPSWVIQKISLKKGCTVIVLDDDPSIHHVWRIRLEKYLPDITLKFFEDGEETINFIKSFKEKGRLTLLSDFELRHQKLDGLDVIKNSNECHNHILVSSIYNRKEIQDEAESLCIKILPKFFIEYIPIILEEKDFSGRPGASCKNVVILDDSKVFADSVSDFLKDNGIGADTYYHPNDLLENLSRYSSNTKIVMDNDFKCSISGYDLARQLYKSGYKKLYVFSGSLDEGLILKYPEGTKIISKASKDCMDDLLNRCKKP